jgi:hypothetical protein
MDTLLPYPKGDGALYLPPINREGWIIPSRDGTIHSIDRTTGDITIQHEDGSISRYAGLENIDNTLQVGDEAGHDMELGSTREGIFFYQRYHETENGKDYIVPGLGSEDLFEDYVATYRAEPPIEGLSSAMRDELRTFLHNLQNSTPGKECYYQLPMNREGYIIPAHAGIIEAINQETGEITVRHPGDGNSLTVYSGLQVIPDGLEVGQDVTREDTLGKTDQRFEYTLKHKQPDGSYTINCQAGYEDVMQHYQQAYQRPLSEARAIREFFVAALASFIGQWKGAPTGQWKDAPAEGVTLEA